MIPTKMDKYLPPEAATEEPVFPDLVLTREQEAPAGTAPCEGTLEVRREGFGFLRRPQHNYLAAPDDVHVSTALIRRLGLRTGMTVAGTASPPPEGRTPTTLAHVERVDGAAPEMLRGRPTFADLTTVHPHRRLTLETGPENVALRILDLLTPIGKGQRGLLVAPPRTGKTVLLQNVARSLLHNHPECRLFVLLIDERPEEVTDMRRGVAGPSAEVVSSTFDRPAEEHIRVAEMVLEKAKRLVECSRDVVILLDSITRLARAYNTEAPAGGRIGTGGIAAGALDTPKRFFGAARQTEEGGSMTILATALIDTGSRMDEVIFEEFKGTGNMELHLDRRLVEKRVWPSIDLGASGTRREELLLTPEALEYTRLLRRVLGGMHPVQAMEQLTSRLRKTTSNAEFLRQLG